MSDSPIFDKLEHPEHVVIDGYKVDPAIVDLFFDMRTGRRVTDAEWDETKARIRAAESQLPPHLAGESDAG